MAIYHFSMQAMRRSAGRSVTAAAAYRSGSLIVDAKSGVAHDYTKKRGVLYSELILSNGGTADRAEFWNAVEAHHKRGDAVLCREIEVSLPRELSPEERQELAVGYAKELADRYGVAADVCLHEPRTVTDRDLERKPDQFYEIDPDTGRRHNGNFHAHIMLSACSVDDDGKLGKKAVMLDPIHCQKRGLPNAADRERGRFAELVNDALLRNKIDVRVDHRTLAAQGIDRAPEPHLGPAAAGYEHRTGKKSKRRIRAEERARYEAEQAEKERERNHVDDVVIFAGLENADYDNDHDDYDRPDFD